MTDALSFSNLEPTMPLEDSVVDADADQDSSEQFLKLFLAPQTTALVAVQNLAEVLSISIGQITPMPHLPAWVMGIYNWRGEVLWMIDLGHLCSLTPWFQQAGNQSSHSAVVLKSEDSSAASSFKVGLVVSRVEDIEWCDPDQIQSSSSSMLSELSNFVCGYYWKADAALAVLDADAIFAALPSQQQQLIPTR